MKSSNSQVQLKQLIDRLISELQLYAQKESASQFYIDRQNNLIHCLTEIYNETEGLQYFRFWQAVEAEMKKIETIAPGISGHTVQIRIRPAGNHFSLIPVNSFNP